MNLKEELSKKGKDKIEKKPESFYSITTGKT